MASLNLSMNGSSIKSSYAGVVNGNATSNSPTHAQWALFSVQAPLVNAFQDSGAKESVLKVESTGDGELATLNEDFNEGRIQFAFVKVKDPNTALPKYILIAWCGGGVPERTKGYFTSHVAAVSKVLHGYHVQITARSENDLDPASIMQKVADASGAKYSGAPSPGTVPRAPPVKAKPVFTPTHSSPGRPIDPIVAARSQRDSNVDADGWGANAPPITRTHIEKVAPAYKPTKVNMAELTSQKPEPSGSSGHQKDQASGDVVKGGYQPVGKVDIAAIRAQAQKTGDDRPVPVKGAYEPVGKVDIAAIKARAQKPVEETSTESNTVAERTAAFAKPQAERLTTLPKPKIAKKFTGAAAYTGTKAPTPGSGYGGPATAPAAPAGGTSRTFADQDGKTPAQLWAEKKARERGESIGGTPQPPAAPVVAQKSGSEWKSGYTGKTWAPVQTGGATRGGGQEAEPVSQQNTGEAVRQAPTEPESPARGVSALRDQFKNTAPISAAAAPPPPPPGRPAEEDEEAPPPPPPPSSRPAGTTGGFALPGLPNRGRPVDDEEEEEEDDASAFQPPNVRESSPIRVAAPVPRSAAPLTEEPPAPPHIPLSQVPVQKEDELADERETADVARRAASGVADQTFDHPSASAGHSEQGGRRAIVQYDYEKAEDNEIDLVEGQYVINIDMVDEDWWMGTNTYGESGLFPSNYVELVEDEQTGAAPPPPPAPGAGAASHAEHVHEHEDVHEHEHGHKSMPAEGAGAGPTATALYDYEAAEDNELSFPEDAKVTNLEFPDEDWWFGHYNGQQGLFPANYVQLDA